MTELVEPHPGLELGSLTVCLDAGTWESFRMAAGHQAAPNPLVAVKEYARLLQQRTGISKVVNAGHEVEFRRAPRLGETVTLTCRVVAVFERKGRAFVQIQTEAVGHGDSPVLTAVTTLIRTDKGESR